MWLCDVSKGMPWVSQQKCVNSVPEGDHRQEDVESCVILCLSLIAEGAGWLSISLLCVFSVYRHIYEIAVEKSAKRIKYIFTEDRVEKNKVILLFV